MRLRAFRPDERRPTDKKRTIVRFQRYYDGVPGQSADKAHDRAHDIAVLGQVIRARRKRLGLTQADLADLAGCGQRTVTAIETGKATVRLDVVVAVLRTLGLRMRVEPGRPVVVADD
ncbi:MAG TPA: helix-turn-helix transcriptional regulator [Acidimicrobiales bacterium]|nr:helix-turn-helix transcriptional regulator [Acidimicrobiales bacterium]